MQEILKEIVQHKRTEVQERKKEFPLSHLEETLQVLSHPRDFYSALFREGRERGAGVPCSLIAEIKKASPSKGVLSHAFDPVHLAKLYESSGASALSILTDERFFQGSLHFIPLVKIHCALPILQKDFIVDEYQIVEARRWGADAILLIASVLKDDEIHRFYRVARDLELSVVIEVHSEPETKRVLPVGSRIIGVNNRDLDSFNTSLETTQRLGALIPEKVRMISESGLFTREDVAYVKEAGADAILVGEAIMTSPDIPSKVRELLGR